MLKSSEVFQWRCLRTAKNYHYWKQCHALESEAFMVSLQDCDMNKVLTWRRQHRAKWEEWTYAWAFLEQIIRWPRTYSSKATKFWCQNWWKIAEFHMLNTKALPVQYGHLKTSLELCIRERLCPAAVSLGIVATSLNPRSECEPAVLSVELVRM